MIPLKTIEELIVKHSSLEKDLSSGELDNKLFAEKSKEYSDVNEIVGNAKDYISFQKEKEELEKLLNDSSVDEELKKMNVKSPTIKDVSKAVIAIRQSKLPDPKRLGNSGSFFKNPVVTVSKFKELESQFPNIPHYPVSEQEIKIPAGWLIETAGFKGKKFGNYGVHKNQALVLVNYGGAKGKDILNLSQTIQKAIDTIFGIPLEAEVNIL